MPTPTPHFAGRRFGVEMEVCARRANGHSLNGHNINAALNAADLTFPVYGNGDYYNSPSGRSGRAWEVKYDASTDYEVVSPAMMLDSDGECEELRNGCTALMGLQPKIDRRCGLHVHVDVSDFTWQEVQKLLGLWVRYEPFFFSLVPQSRQGNTYCRELRAATWQDAYTRDNAPFGNGYTAKRALEQTTRAGFERATRDLGKYKTLRMDMWALNGRVEFRMHSGTVNYKKIRNWVRLLLSLVGRVKASRDSTVASRVPTRVRALSNANGFGPAYVLTILGLGPNGLRGDENIAATMPVYDDLMAWIPTRQARFHGGRRAS